MNTEISNREVQDEIEKDNDDLDNEGVMWCCKDPRVERHGMEPKEEHACTKNKKWENI